MISLKKLEDNIALVELDHAEQNRFNPIFTKKLLEVLEELEGDSSIHSVIFMGKHRKFFSAGFDTEWAQSHSREEVIAFFEDAHKALLKTLLLPKATIACINGHAFGLGAIWACAFDFRLMNAHRGWFAFPSVDIGIKVPPPMIELSQSVIPIQYREEVLLLGKRLSGPEAERMGIVRSAHQPEELLPAAIELAKTLAKKDPECYAITKRVMRREMAQILQNAGPEGLPFT